MQGGQEVRRTGCKEDMMLGGQKVEESDDDVLIVIQIPVDSTSVTSIANVSKHSSTVSS